MEGCEKNTEQQMLKLALAKTDYSDSEAMKVKSIETEAVVMPTDRIFTDSNYTSAYSVRISFEYY